MAIEQIPYRDTDEFVNTKSRFWPVQIPISHWQLRHFISNPDPGSNRLYYAAGTEVFCLDTQTKQHRLIAKLPFNARCTASGHGWVGVGGEKEGHYFAAIKLDGSGPRTLDVDAALPLGAWQGARRSPSVRLEKVGEQIVNSISIHRLRDDEAHLDDVVAVVTNNDKTVRVFSLPQNTDAYTLHLPHPVNHATISPDGKSMIVVGDYAQAFVYARHIKRSPPQIPKPHNRLSSADVAWHLIGEYDLFLTTKTAPQGYFTTAWSPDGRYVAVGSEDGYITVFDAGKITQPQADLTEAIISIIPSSRPAHPNPYPGAVRTMIFSPSPWDLLIWAEDQGRVCVSDARSGFRTKQVLSLDPKDDSQVQVTDAETVREGAGTPDSFDRLFSETQRDLASMEAEFLRRHRDNGQDSTHGFAPNYVEARRWERQRAIARFRHGYTDDPQGLTAREQQILDTLRESRQRQEAHFASGGSGVTYTTPDVLAPYSMRARMIAGDSAEPPELVRVSSSSNNNNTANESSSDLLPPDAFTELDYAALNRASVSTRLRATRPRDASTLSQTWSRSDHDNTHRSGRPRGQWPSIFLPTPPRSQPATSSPAPETVSLPAENDPDHTNGYNEADESDDEDEAEDADDDVWRSLDDAILNTRGPLFEYAARAQPDPPSQVETTRDDRDIRQRYLLRQRERLREAREASLSRASDHAALPTLMRTRAAIDGFDYEGLLRRRMPGREIAVRTTGLAMSDDGSTLWAACEEGIFEFQMNRKARMFWPAIELR